MHRRAGGAVQVTLPSEYEPWLRTNALGAAAAPAHAAGPLRIESPRDGERYFLAPDLPATVQSIALRAQGGDPRAPVLWEVDGRAAGAGREARWLLAPGRHRITATSGAERAAPVRIDVARPE
jgi:hypothetical protein